VTSTTNQSTLLREDSDGVATLTMNRPPARNSLSREMLDRLLHEFDVIATDKTVRVVIIAATGPAFCAGHDMKQLRANPAEAYYKSLFALSSRLMKEIVDLPKPVIAQVHAIATAAGCQLVASCDLAVAARSAAFATPGVNIGLFCSTPLVALTRNVGRKRAMEMLLTGDAIDAETAAEFGLINRVVADDRLAAETLELATQIAEKSPLAIAIGKRAFYSQIDLEVGEAYDVAAEAMARNMLAHDAEEGIDAFLEKRAPRWEGR
jgi:enoyl-CoA hydratase/carnithine racemase